MAAIESSVDTISRILILPIQDGEQGKRTYTLIHMQLTQGSKFRFSVSALLLEFESLLNLNKHPWAPSHGLKPLRVFKCTLSHCTLSISGEAVLHTYVCKCVRVRVRVSV